MSRTKQYDKYYEKKECVVCGKEYYTAKEKRNVFHTRPIGVRPRNCKTCSKNCARKFNKVKQTKKWKQKK